MEAYINYLAAAIKYKETGTGNHEWLMNSKKEAVQVANYLRSFGYVIEYKHYPKMAQYGCGHLIIIK